MFLGYTPDETREMESTAPGRHVRIVRPEEGVRLDTLQRAASSSSSGIRLASLDDQSKVTTTTKTMTTTATTTTTTKTMTTCSDEIRPA